MTDITKCSWSQCPLKHNCHRYTALADKRQSYFIEPPIKDGKCEYFWDNKDYDVKIFNDDEDFNTLKTNAQ